MARRLEPKLQQTKRLPSGLPTLNQIDTLFRLLFYSAALLLWLSSALNGTIMALIHAVWTGRFENGTPLRLRYTGIPLLDYPLAVLVAFFYPGTSGLHEFYSLFLLDVYISLQICYLWLYVEALRAGQKPRWIRSPVYIALLWQACGGAVALPLYFGMHMRWASQVKTTPVSRLDEARALPMTFLLGAVAPMLLLMAPIWLGPEARSPSSQQAIIALFQASPLYVSCIMIAGTWMGQMSQNYSSDTLAATDRGQASRWVRATYLLAAAMSAVGHIFVLARAVFTTDAIPGTLRLMYLPLSSSHPATVSETLVRGSWLFLQWDNIIIAAAGLAWALLLLIQDRVIQRPAIGITATFFLLGSVVLGPGTIVTLALYYREGCLPAPGMDRNHGDSHVYTGDVFSPIPIPVRTRSDSPLSFI